MRHLSLIVLPLLLAACTTTGDGYEQHIATSQETTTITMPAQYAMMSGVSSDAIEPVAAGHVSRYQRDIIVPGGPEPTTECGKNFSQIMDHLETLMAPAIAENNRIAEQQAAIPGYTF